MKAAYPGTELARIAAVLTAPDDNLGPIIAATDALHRLCLGRSSLDPAADASREPLDLPAGRAIGPIWAADCIRDFLRTKQFVRGLYLAIRAAQTRFPGETIHILYAGTGPFATLALPMTALFTPADIQFTLLEINPQSLQLLEEIVETFQIRPFIRNIVRADATQYRSDPHQPAHILLTETMQSALRREPQVAITLNLASQLPPGGLLLPQCITVSAALLDPQKDQARMTDSAYAGGNPFLSLGQILQLDGNSWKTLPLESVQAPFAGLRYPPVTFDLPPQAVTEGYTQLVLLTEIDVFENERLLNWQCALTHPYRVTKFEPGKRLPDKIRFQYQVGENPGLHWDLL